VLKIELFSHLFWWHFVCAQILVAHVCAGSDSGKLSSVPCQGKSFCRDTPKRHEVVSFFYFSCRSF